MRIAVYGGTFNPVHIGHTSLALSLVDQDIVDEVWMMVSPQNPHKDNDAAQYTDRINMARLATRGMKGIAVSNFESRLPIPSYTFTTLSELELHYPQHRFHLVIGADNWQNFHRWYRAQDIMARYPIFIYRRPHYEIDMSAIPTISNITIVDTPLFDVSSTEIRAGQKLDMIHPRVLKYIQKHQLYFLTPVE